MSQTDNPDIRSYNGEEEYTMHDIIYSRFRKIQLTDDAIALLSKRVYDMAGMTQRM